MLNQKRRTPNRNSLRPFLLEDARHRSNVVQRANRDEADIHANIACPCAILVMDEACAARVAIGIEQQAETLEAGNQLFRQLHDLQFYVEGLIRYPREVAPRVCEARYQPRAYRLGHGGR